MLSTTQNNFFLAILVFSNKARSHAWSLENKNPPKALTSTTGPCMQYFISIPTSSRLWNTQVYSSATCWWQRCQRYDLYCSLTWDSFMHWIVCKYPTTYTSHPKPSTSITWTSILSLVLLFTYIQCNLRHFCFNPTTTKFIWTKQIFYSTSFRTIFH